MADRPLDNLTLREMLTDTERLSREMVEHLDQNFIPKAHSLRKLARPTATGGVDEEVEDISIRNSANQVLKSEEFSDALYEKISQYCQAIDTAVSQIQQ